MPSDKDNHSLRPLGWCKIILSTSSPNLSPLVWFQCPRPRGEEHTLALLRRSRGSILSSNTNVPLGLVTMLMVTVDGTEEEEGEERENLFECKTTVLNTRGWASVEEREKIKKTETSPSHERIDASIFFSLSLCLLLKLLRCFPSDSFSISLWSMKDDQEQNKLNVDERERQRRTRNHQTLSDFIFSSCWSDTKIFSLLRNYYHEKNSELSFSLSLSRSLKWICFRLASCLFLSLSLDLTKVEYSLVIERTSEREIERGKETGCLHTSSQMICYCCHFFSQSIRSILMSMTVWFLFLPRWIIGVRQRD